MDWTEQNIVELKVKIMNLESENTSLKKKIKELEFTITAQSETIRIVEDERRRVANKGRWSI